MSSLIGITRRSRACVALLVAVGGCSSLHLRSRTSASPDQRLSEAERIAHVLSRLTFGPRSGDAERVAAMGVDRWIDYQLHPESIDDGAVRAALAVIPSWNQPTTNLSSLLLEPRFASMTMAALVKDSVARTALTQIQARIASIPTLNDYFSAGKIIHAQVGERQLLEVVSDFWENHFSVYNGKMPSRESLIVWDRDVLRPHALGKFRDLLGAVAHSPAMLFYLDNHLSTNRGLNENYARELLELHTLGVDGGYTQHDVIEVARALTGWTITPSPNPTLFAFRPDLHDSSTKTVLGHTLRAGRGIEDGEEVLDIIARHPATARHIALKLARRLVSDDPPPAVVDRAAATFARTDGDIAQVVRTIVMSPEFFSRAAFRAKVKTPFELVVSARRALDAPADTTPATARLIAQLGQPTFGWQAPNGWPETGDAWMNSGTIYNRIKFAWNLVNESVAFAPLDQWRDWRPLSTLTLDRQVNGVMKDIFSGCHVTATRDAMLTTAGATTADSTAGDGPRRLKAVLEIAFASPEFQRR
jgi:hypothetical protein